MGLCRASVSNSWNHRDGLTNQTTVLYGLHALLGLGTTPSSPTEPQPALLHCNFSVQDRLCLSLLAVAGELSYKANANVPSLALPSFIGREMACLAQGFFMTARAANNFV